MGHCIYNHDVTNDAKKRGGIGGTRRNTCEPAHKSSIMRTFVRITHPSHHTSLSLFSQHPPSKRGSARTLKLPCFSVSLDAAVDAPTKPWRVKACWSARTHAKVF